jgi:hypothetical protein
VGAGERKGGSTGKKAKGDGRGKRPAKVRG